MSEDKVQPDNVNDSSADSAQESHDKPPVRAVYVGKKDSRDYAPTAYEERKRRKRKPLSGFEIWTIILAGVGILVAAGTGLAIVWQDRIASSTLGELHRQYPELQKSANAADQGIRDSRANFKNDQRPYIWIRSMLDAPKFRLNPIVKDQGQIVWDWHVINYGKTPAQNIRFRQYMSMGNKPFVSSYGEKKDTPSAPIPPTADIVFDTVISAPITPEQYNALIKTDYGIQIKVILDYSDLQGGTYETAFCLSRLQSGAISFCGQDNYIK